MRKNKIYCNTERRTLKKKKIYIYSHKRMRDLLLFNIYRDIGVKLEKEHRYDNVWKSVEISL